MSTVPKNDEQLRSAVRERYGRAALQVTDSSSHASCCGTDCCSASEADAVSVGLYNDAELGELPVAAALASLGCGNPTALAALNAGERVLDLGSGGGIDVLLSARRVGPTGFAYGLDMTDEMLELAERNRAEAKVGNVRFLKGIIEMTAEFYHPMRLQGNASCTSLHPGDFRQVSIDYFVAGRESS
jgi:arsenite methyltransferase